jgi:hypothetical protein
VLCLSLTSRSVSRDSRAPRKTGFLGASQRAYTLSRAVYDRLTLRASPIYNTDTRGGPARAKANEKYASNAACQHNSAKLERGEDPVQRVLYEHSLTYQGLSYNKQD